MTRNVHRRDALRAGATVGALALAGCLGGGGDGDDVTETGTDSGETDAQTTTGTDESPQFPAVTVDEAYPMFQADGGNTGTSGNTGPDGPVARRWHFETAGSVFTTPVVTDGAVIVADQNGRVFAVDAAAGTERWLVEFETGPEGTPAVHDGAVLVSDGRDGLVALDAETGDERWRYTADGGLTAAPAVVDGTAYVAGGTAVHAVDAADGTHQWSFERAEWSPAGEVAVGDDAVFVPAGYEAGELTAIEAADGTERWTVGVDDLITEPVVVDETVYLASEDIVTEIHALDTRTGDTRRSHSTGSPVEASPVVAPSPDTASSRAVFAEHSGDIYALEDDDWEEPVWGGRAAVDGNALFIQENPAMADGTVYYPADSRFAAFDFETGEPLWAAAVESEVYTGLSVASGLLFVGGDDGVSAYQTPV